MLVGLQDSIGELLVLTHELHVLLGLVELQVPDFPPYIIETKPELFSSE